MMSRRSRRKRKSGKRELRLSRKRKREQLARLSRELNVLPVEPMPVSVGGEASGTGQIFPSEVKAIREAVLAYPELETGGEVYGFWNERGEPVVCLVTGPGPNACRSGVSFTQDQEWAARLSREIIDSMALSLIGFWHSHHQLGLDRPSYGDVASAVRTVRDLSVTRFLCCIANIRPGGGVSFIPYCFTKDGGGNHASVDLFVPPKATVSPFRAIWDSDRMSGRVIA